MNEFFVCDDSPLVEYDPDHSLRSSPGFGFEPWRGVAGPRPCIIADHDLDIVKPGRAANDGFHFGTRHSFVNCRKTSFGDAVRRPWATVLPKKESGNHEHEEDGQQHANPQFEFGHSDTS